jgi:hypothetical protein
LLIFNITAFLISSRKQDKILYEIDLLKVLMLEQTSILIEYKKDTYCKLADLHSDSSRMKQSIASLVELAERPKEVKKNNWDSIREVFTGQIKAEVNDRT